jgi:hypothetical protein
MVHACGMVCMISPIELAALEAGVALNCADHKHISRRRADELNELNFNTPRRKEREAEYVGRGKRYMVYNRARCWKKVMSGGFAVMQLVLEAC